MCLLEFKIKAVEIQKFQNLTSALGSAFSLFSLFQPIREKTKIAEIIQKQTMLRKEQLLSFKIRKYFCIHGGILVYKEHNCLKI